MQSIQVFVIEPFDKSKPMLVDNLKTMLANPPESYFWKASELLERERTTGVAKNVTIMCLEERGGSSYRSSSNDMVWRDAGKADTFDNTVTYYYIPLSGFNALNKCNNVKDLSKFLKRSKVHVGEIYGVRKGDIEFIKTQKNWIELDTLIVEQLGKLDNKNLMGVVKQALDINEIIKYNSSDVNAKSPLALLSNTFKDVEAVDNNVTLATQWLCKMYDVKTSSSPQALIDKYTEEVNDIKNRYPLLRGLSFYQTDHKAVAEYINLVDQAKGV
jgi:hypothetical protein